MHIALHADQIKIVLRKDVGRSDAVRDHLHRRYESGQCDRRGPFRQAPAPVPVSGVRNRMGQNPHEEGSQNDMQRPAKPVPGRRKGRRGRAQGGLLFARPIADHLQGVVSSRIRCIHFR